MKRYVFMKLREAKKEDFADQWGSKRIGAMYFQQSVTGAICTQPFYFNEDTNIEAFKELYTANQIFVPMGIFDKIEVIEEKEQTITNL
jgi:hypothetical protein